MTTARLITAAGTVDLRGRAAAFCEAIGSLQAELEPLRVGSLEFHFAGGKVSVKVVKSTLIRCDD